MSEPYMTEGMVAEILQHNIETIRWMAAKEALPATLVAGEWRFDAAALREWLKERHSSVSDSEVRVSSLWPELQFAIIRNQLLVEASRLARARLLSPSRMLGPATDRPRVPRLPQHDPAAQRAPRSPLPALPREVSAHRDAKRAARARWIPYLRTQPVLAHGLEPAGGKFTLRLRIQ